MQELVELKKKNIFQTENNFCKERSCKHDPTKMQMNKKEGNLVFIVYMMLFTCHMN